MSFSLRILEGKNQGEEYLLAKGENLVGRSRSSFVRVYNEDVSGKHFILEITDHGAILHNISAYGTSIDGTEVLKDAEIHPGQVISAGRTLKMLFSENKDEDEDGNYHTNSEITCVTKFVADTTISVGKENTSEDSEVTEVTKIHTAKDQEEETSVTNFEHKMEEEETSVTSFEHKTEDEETQATSFTANPRTQGEVTDAGENGDETVLLDNSNTTVIEETSCEEDGMETTQIDTVPDMMMDRRDETLPETEVEGSTTIPDETTAQKEETTIPDAVSPAGEEPFPREDAPQKDSGEPTHNGLPDDVMEEQGAYFEEEDVPDSEKTNADETQVVQTRMASADEMNLIKKQLKRQQQSKQFFMLMVVIILVIILGLFWMTGNKQKKDGPIWPQGRGGVFLTDGLKGWDGGYFKGTFNLYYPHWSQNQVEQNENTIRIHTFLGSRGDIPLEISLERDASAEHVYENHKSALDSVLNRVFGGVEVSYKKDPEKHFFISEGGTGENGICYSAVKYQREHASADGSRSSWSGIMRFFRAAQYNYVLMVEVPTSEWVRAYPVLYGDAFLQFSKEFVQRHWEGSTEFNDGDKYKNEDLLAINVADAGIMEYSAQELKIKRILAKTAYYNKRTEYENAMKLLVSLREKQKTAYEGLRVEWMQANVDKKSIITEKGRAIFSPDDKRRYDILTQNWE